MPAESSSPTRRDLLTTAAVVGAATLIPSALHPATGSEEIRPFSVSFPQSDLADLRRRIAATRWPEKETVADDHAGRAARDDAEARAAIGRPTTTGARCEAQLNALPQLHHRDRRARHSFHSRPLEA